MKALLRVLTCLSALTVLPLASCAHATSPPERSWTTDDARLLVSDRGMNKYVYAVTRTGPTRPPANAAATVSLLDPLTELNEIAIINVTAEFGGWGIGGLARNEAELYGDLADVAQKLGGTRFRVAKTSLAQGVWISNAVVSVLAPR